MFSCLLRSSQALLLGLLYHFTGEVYELLLCCGGAASLHLSLQIVSQHLYALVLGEALVEALPIVAIP